MSDTAKRVASRNFTELLVVPEGLLFNFNRRPQASHPGVTRTAELLRRVYQRPKKVRR